MIKFSKIIYGFLVVIAVAAHIGTTFAVNDSVSTKSKKVEFVDSSKNIYHENTTKDSDIKIERKNSISPLDRWIMAVSRIKYGFWAGLCSVSSLSNIKAAVRTATASSQLMVVESNLNPSNSNTLSILKKRNEFCKNKSYVHSAMHVFTKGFSQSFHRKLDCISLMISRDFIFYTPDVGYFAGYFNDFITGKDPFDYMYVSDKFFKSFDCSIHQIRQQHAKYDNIAKDFLCSNKLTQDPDKFIKGVLTILGMEKSPLVTSQVETKPFYIDDHELDYHGSDYTGIKIEELTTVQTIPLKENARVVANFFEGLCAWRRGKLDEECVFLHVDTEKFSHLIVKFEIFVDSSDAKYKLASKKVEDKKREIINSSESVIIQVRDINDIGCVDKKDAVKYKLTPRAVISHKGDTLEGGHFIAKILTEKSSENKEDKWTMYDKNKEVSAQKRSGLSPGYDDYIIVYEADREFD